jgi:hypothetical protein
LVVGFGVAVVIGRSISLADRRERSVLRTADLPGVAPVAARVRRRRIPLPPFAVGLAALAVALELTGYAVRLSGTPAPVLSMDAPLSLPRMYVAALFAAAALAALAGAGRLPGRRAWWTAVALVTGAIAAVKAGGTVHAVAMAWLADRVGTGSALVVSLVLAAAVVGALWYLSRHERRDRRRVLGSLAGYAFASVVLSGVSTLVAVLSADETWTAAATFVEESGEALAGVSVLVAVLVGVAPRLVLPAGWVLRREADAHTLDLAPVDVTATLRRR